MKMQIGHAMSKQISTKWIGMPTTTKTMTKKLLQNKQCFFFILDLLISWNSFVSALRPFGYCCSRCEKSEENSNSIDNRKIEKNKQIWIKTLGEIFSCSSSEWIDQNRVNFLMRMFYKHWMRTLKQVRNNILVFLVISTTSVQICQITFSDK